MWDLRQDGPGNDDAVISGKGEEIPGSVFPREAHVLHHVIHTPFKLHFLDKEERKKERKKEGRKEGKKR